jgi:hypothetical protein
MKSLMVVALIFISSTVFAQKIDIGSLFEGFDSDKTYHNLEIIDEENECLGNEWDEGTERVLFKVPLSGLEINDGEKYFGISYYGDISVVSNSKDGPVLDLYLCPRLDLDIKTAIQATAFKVESSDYCAIDQITFGNLTIKAEINLDESIGLKSRSFNVGFSPISIPGPSRKSSLCENNEEIKVSQQKRSNKVVADKVSPKNDLSEVSGQ